MIKVPSNNGEINLSEYISHNINDYEKEDLNTRLRKILDEMELSKGGIIYFPFGEYDFKDVTFTTGQYKNIVLKSDGATIKNLTIVTNCENFIMSGFNLNNFTLQIYSTGKVNFTDNIVDSSTDSCIILSSAEIQELNILRNTFKNIAYHHNKNKYYSGNAFTSVLTTAIIHKFRFDDNICDVSDSDNFLYLKQGHFLNFSINRNKFTRCDGRAICFENCNSDTVGEIFDNEIRYMGYTRETSGVGNNGIYITRADSSFIPDIKISRNKIKDVGENGIEVSAEEVSENWIENTNYYGKTTPSKEGIYGTIRVIKNNFIKNSKGDGIISLFNGAEILYNTITNDSVNSNYSAIQFANTDYDYQNILVQNNHINNYYYAFWFVGLSTERTYSNVKLINNTSTGHMELIRDTGSVEVGIECIQESHAEVLIQNPNFRAWTGTTVDNWLLSNGTLTKVDNTTFYSAKITATDNFHGRIKQYIEIPVNVRNPITLYVTLKSSSGFLVNIIDQLASGGNSTANSGYKTFVHNGASEDWETFTITVLKAGYQLLEIGCINNGDWVEVSNVKAIYSFN